MKTKDNYTVKNETSSKNELNYIPYYLKMYKADSLFLINNFSESYKILDSLFRVYPPRATDNYVEYGIYVCSAVMSGHLEDIEKKARFGYSHFGGIATVHKDAYNMEQAVIRAAALSENEIKFLKAIYQKSLNLELRKKMLIMFKEDQLARTNGDNAQMDSIDHINRSQLEEIFKDYGYPDINLIGASSAWDMADGDIREGILFVHQPDDFKEKYLPFLLENIKNGKCDPDTYALVYDRMMMDKYEKQYFGTYNCSSTEFCNLIEPNKVDSIRISIGLPRLKYYPWRMMQRS
ncbi:hypothetical protein OIU83_01255 [Flavobacterium sp. LS1R49]|uniref:Uncharacterized protein n=2 Tax=Flavobacterium shii TaxID=2987687 RepID=A0A9X3C6B1_9FLAO|nr:hypothetical protein [Flavobacterium shii]